MIKNKQRRIPEVPRPLPAAAKALDIEEKFLLQWLFDGEIRACVNFLDYYTCNYSATTAFTPKDVNLKEVYESFLEIDTQPINQNETATDSYSNEEDIIKCPLSNLFSTQHSSILVDKCRIHENGDSADIDADLKGLWQIDTTEAIKYIFNNPNDDYFLINVVPYIPENLYQSHVNKTQSSYIDGFPVAINLDEICISYDDMKRLYAYLYEGKELTKLDGTKTTTERVSTKKQRSPSIQASTLLVQVLNAYCPFAKELLNQPCAALERLEKDFAKRGINPPELSYKTLSRIITTGKRYL